MKGDTLRVQAYPLPKGHDWLWIEPPVGAPVLLLDPRSATFKAVAEAVGNGIGAVSNTA